MTFTSRPGLTLLPPRSPSVAPGIECRDAGAGRAAALLVALAPVTTLTPAAALKMVWAYCSPGKHILGTGFQLNRANGKVFVNRVWPTGTMEGVEVHAYADVLNDTGQVAEGDLNAPPPWSGVWDLKAFATVFVDLLGDYQVDYRLSTMALEALSLDPAKPGPGSVHTTTTRVSVDRASDWVIFVYPHCF